MAHKAEILAPCGSFETLEAALRSGCDAVYLGGEKFSARQNAANFTDEQLKEAVRLCHLRGVKGFGGQVLSRLARHKRRNERLTMQAYPTKYTHVLCRY